MAHGHWQSSNLTMERLHVDMPFGNWLVIAFGQASRDDVPATVKLGIAESRMYALQGGEWHYHIAVAGD